MHDTTRAILELFDSSHLPEHLRYQVQPFEVLAQEIAGQDTARPAEQTTCLRKLLEAKDCAVRMAVPRAGS
jgi:hypothetical protein